MNTQSLSALAGNRHMKITAIALGLLLIAGLVWYIRAGAASYSKPINFATTITVNTPLDITDPNDNLCSLREAIIAANNNTVPSGPGVKECPAGMGLDTIIFDLGTGTPTIGLTSPLPIITDPVVINGNTGGATRVGLFGGNAGAGANGLSVSAGNSTIESLVINHFLGSAIVLTNGANNLVQDCYIGTDASGTHDEGNGLGITVFSSNNRIGGTTPAERNIISANAGPVVPGRAGVKIDGPEAHDNLVQGNYIGTTVNGNFWLGNGTDGVYILGGAKNNTIGGAAAGAGNLISGNAQRGVYLTDSGTTGNVIQGNFIGTDATGTVALLGNPSSNGNSGIAAHNGASNTLILNNLISGMQAHGVEIAFNTGDCIVRGNLIGTNAGGTAAIPNLGVGVLINYSSTGNTVGGTTANDRNVISANGGGGVAIGNDSNNNTLQGNFIGTNSVGAALGNNLQGVVIIDSANNTIGGPVAGAGNQIAYNSQKGVDILGASAASNRVLVNSIFSNGALGIDLNDDYVTANDAGDLDTGPNNLQNFPVLTQALPNLITGTLNSAANKTFTIQFFSNPACDASGYGEGKTYRGQEINVTTDGSGNATFSHIPPPIPLGEVVTATATDPDGNTSEFSPCLTVTACPTVTLTTPIANGATGVAYTQPIVASPSGTYSYAVTGGAMPPGLTINSSTGTISGTPTTPGKYMFTITATDPNGCSGSQSYTVFIICSGSNCPCYQVPSASNMVSWWPFEETTGPVADDIRGAVDNAGTYGAGAAAPTPVANGMVGRALLFDGLNDFVQVPHDPEIDIGGSCATGNAEDFTIDAWIRSDGPGTGYQVIMDKRGTTGVLPGYVLYLLNGRIGIQINGMEYNSPALLPLLTNNQWHFIAVTVQRCPTPKGRFYVDGAPILTVVMSSSASNSMANSNPLFIGNRSALLGGGLPFNGRLDELELFKSVLPEAELAGIYLAGPGGKCKPALSCPTSISPPSLPAGIIGVPYSQQFTQMGCTGGATWSLAAGALPNGMTLNATTGVISGTPTASDTFDFTIKVTCVGGCMTTKPYTLTIAPCLYVLSPTNAAFGGGGGSGAVGLTTASSSSGCAWTAVSNDPWITVTNGAFGTGNGTVNYIVAPNTGPPRSGTITIAGQTFTVTQGSCPVITVNPAALPNGLVGTAYSQTLTATGGSAPYKSTISAGAAPNGLNLSSGGVLSGTPSAAGTFNFTVKVADINGCIGTRAYTITINPLAPIGLQFYPLAKPLRLLDTRPANQLPGAAFDTPGTKLIGLLNGGVDQIEPAQVTFDGLTIPATAKAIVGTATVINFPSAGGYTGTGNVTFYPSDAVKPEVSNLNYSANQTISNGFTVGLSAAGAFSIFSYSDVHLVVEVVGYYAPPAAGGLYYHPLGKPFRLLETRANPIYTGCDTPHAPLIGGGIRTEQGRVTCDGVTIPAAALGLLGNLTAVNASASGLATIYASDLATTPIATSLAYNPTQAIANAFVTRLGSDGSFKLFVSKTTDVLVDIFGYYSPDANDVNGPGLLFTQLDHPIRLLETRPGFPGCNLTNAPLAAGSNNVQLAWGSCDGVTIPGTARAINGNVTAVTTTPATVISFGSGNVTLYPSTANPPDVSNLNYIANQNIPNAFTVGLSNDGKFTIFVFDKIDLLIDVSGYFAP